MRAAFALILAICALLIGCGGGDDDASGGGERTKTSSSTAATTATAPPPGRGPERRAKPAPLAPPDPDERISRSPARLSARLAEVSRALRREIEAWRATRPGVRARPPRRITLLALYQQRSYRTLARRPALAAATIRRMPPWLRGEARDSAGALRALFTLTSLETEARFRTRRPQPPDLLRRYYRAAERRFGVEWHVLAAINLIESNYGRLKNVSNAGAVGPMQFLPSTWEAYGLGGDINDHRDAILGAANYLRASGAPASYSRAVYAYNPSPHYVRAILRFAHRIGTDPRAYYAYWSWQSFRRTATDDVQLTGPGAR